MLNDEITVLIEAMNRRLKATPVGFHRSLASRIAWDDRLLSIKGPRGVGKTTMLLQHVKESVTPRETALYVSLDNLFFARHGFRDVVDWHWKNGGTLLLADEVHHLENWQMELKNVHDDYPEMRIAYTGSSMLSMDHGQGDLSRRQTIYTLPGLSFREFLSFEGVLDFPVQTLEDVLSSHMRLAKEVTGKVRILPLFRRYLESGYYPFYREVKSGYDQRLQEIVNAVLENDYPAIEKVNYETIGKTRRMLMILSASTPQTPNMSKLYAELRTDRNQGLKMLDALGKAGLLRLLSTQSKKLKTLARPDKIYCDNTNLMHTLSPSVDVGSLRETFFLNQVSQAHEVSYPTAGDFLVDGEHLFEIGGAGKRFNQIKDIPGSYVAADDMEIGHGNKIPLWLFGFLY